MGRALVQFAVAGHVAHPADDPQLAEQAHLSDSTVAEAVRIADAPERQKPLRIDKTHGIPQLTLKFEVERRPPFQRVAVREIAFTVSSVLRFHA